MNWDFNEEHITCLLTLVWNCATKHWSVAFSAKLSGQGIVIQFIGTCIYYVRLQREKKNVLE